MTALYPSMAACTCARAEVTKTGLLGVPVRMASYVKELALFDDDGLGLDVIPNAPNPDEYLENAGSNLIVFVACTQVHAEGT